MPNFIEVDRLWQFFRVNKLSNRRLDITKGKLANWHRTLGYFCEETTVEPLENDFEWSYLVAVY